MRKTSKCILVGLAAGAITAGAGWAAHHEGGGADKGHRHKRHAHMFDKRDSDGSGEVSKAEWMAASEERFAEMDADGNGSVSKPEWEAAHKRMKERWKRKRQGDGE